MLQPKHHLPAQEAFSCEALCQNYVLAMLEAEEEQGLFGDAKESSSLKTQLGRVGASFGTSVSPPSQQDSAMGVGSYLTIAS